MKLILNEKLEADNTLLLFYYRKTDGDRNV